MALDGNVIVAEESEAVDVSVKKRLLMVVGVAVSGVGTEWINLAFASC